MKRFVLVAVLVALLAVGLASTALAAPPTPNGMGPGNGIHTPGTGLSQPGTGYGAGGGMRRGAPAWAGQPAEVQTLLGMTQEQIQAERLAGKSLVQIAQSKGVTEQKLVETILAAKKATLDKQVSGGTLTQAQADYAYSHMQTQVSVMVNRTTTGPAGAQGNAQMGRRWANQ